MENLNLESVSNFPILPTLVKRLNRIEDLLRGLNWAIKREKKSLTDGSPFVGDPVEEWVSELNEAVKSLNTVIKDNTSVRREDAAILLDRSLQTVIRWEKKGWLTPHEKYGGGISYRTNEVKCLRSWYFNEPLSDQQFRHPAVTYYKPYTGRK